MFDIISVGDCGIDTIVKIHEANVHCNLNKEDCQLCIRYADKILADDLQTKTAYNAMNNAVGSARLNLKTGYYGVVGGDMGGQRILQVLKEEGIGTSHVYVEKKKKTNASVVINFRGERTILVHHEKFTYRWPRFTPTKWFYVTSMGVGFIPFYKRIAKQAKQKNIKIGFNPGTYQLKAGVKKLAPLLQASTVLFLNKEEARLLTGISEERDIKELLYGMRKLGPAVAVLTDGDRGSYASDGKNFFRCGLYPAKVVERTGAGDAFATAFVAALIHDESIDQALRWGSCNAAGVIQKIGPQDGLLTLKEIKKALVKRPSFKAHRF